MHGNSDNAMSKLRLTDWADVFGILSAVAVVASLYYVAVELDDNTATHKARNQRELIDALQQLEYGWVQDADGLPVPGIPHISGGKDTGNTGFQQQWIAVLEANRTMIPVQ